MNIELNSRGVNKLIKATILSDEKMVEAGFRKIEPANGGRENYWRFSKQIHFPKDKRWKDTEISFVVKIPEDGSDIDIVTIDDDFGQAYDYQYILEKNPNNECANIVKSQVEEWMEYLQNIGVLSGHEYGEYI